MTFFRKLLSPFDQSKRPCLITAPFYFVHLSAIVEQILLQPNVSSAFPHRISCHELLQIPITVTNYLNKTIQKKIKLIKYTYMFEY